MSKVKTLRLKIDTSDGAFSTSMEIPISASCDDLNRIAAAWVESARQLLQAATVQSEPIEEI